MVRHSIVRLTVIALVGFGGVVVGQSIPGRVAYWAGDGIATDSVGTNHGVPRNGLSFAPGIKNLAFQFDGVDDFLQVPDGADLTFNGDYSFSFWVKADVIPPGSYAPLWNKRWDSDGLAPILVGLDNRGTASGLLADTGLASHDNALIFSMGGGAGVATTVAVNWAIEPGVFHHVVVSISGSTMRVHLNGQLRATKAFIGVRQSISASLAAGCYALREAPYPGVPFFPGAMDEIELFNRALTDTEVAAIFQALRPATTPTTSAVAHWPGEGSGAEIVGGADGVLLNGTTFASGRIGQAFVFDGTDDYIRIPHRDSIGFNGDFTMSLWVRSTPVPPGGYYTIISKRWQSDFSSPIGLGIDNRGTGPGSDNRLFTGLSSLDNALLFSVGGGGSCVNANPWTGCELPMIGVNNAIPYDGQFHHVALSVQGLQMRMHIDGVLRGTRTITGQRPLSGAPLLVGAYGFLNQLHPSPSFFSGALDDLKYFNRALSDAEILAIYNPASTTITSSPVGMAFVADGMSYVSPQTFNWAPGSTHTVNWVTPVAGVTGTRSVFTGWTDGDGSNPRSITAPAGLTTFTATFGAQYLLTTSAGAGGTVSPVSGWFTAGSTVAVSAVANAGYVFSGFGGDLSGSTTPQNLVMSGPKSVTATFALSGQTVVRLIDSLGNPLAGGTAEYYSSSWKPFGVTDASGQATASIPTGTYPFRISYAGGQQQVSQNIGTNPVVMFQTRSVTVLLKDSAGMALDTGTVQYYGGAWLSFGSTTGGMVKKELLAGSYPFQMSYAGAPLQVTQDIGANPVVVFQTRAVTVQLKNSAGTALDTGTVQYYAGAWLPFGTTSGGQVQKELLAGSYPFRLTYGGA